MTDEPMDPPSLTAQVRGAASHAWPWLILSVVSTIGAAFLSTRYLSMYPYATVVLPWEFPAPIIMLAVLSPLFLAVAVVRDPPVAWAALAVAALTTSGILVLRFPLLDEALAGAVLASLLLAIGQGRLPRQAHGYPWWAFLFFLWTLVIVASSLHGWWTYGNIKAARYVVLGAILLGLGWVFSRYQVGMPDARTAARIVLVSTISYYSVYLVHGWLFSDTVHHYVLDGIGFAGVGLRDAISIVGAPVAVWSLGRLPPGWRVTAVVSILLGLLVAVLADSRGAILYTLASLLLAPAVIGWKRSGALAAGALLAAVVFGAIVFQRPQWPLDMAQSVAQVFTPGGGTYTFQYFGRDVVAARGDSGRFLFVQAAFETLATGPWWNALGVGWYGYYPAATDTIRSLSMREGIPFVVVNPGSVVGGIAEPPRPPHLGPYILETGVPGVALLTALVLVLCLCIGLARTGRGIRLRRPNMPIVLVPLLAIASTYFAGTIDMALFGFALMPGGLLAPWAMSATEGPTGRGTHPLRARARAAARRIGDRVATTFPRARRAYLKAYWRRRAPKGHDNHPSVPEVARWAMDWKPERVLELGCGRGAVLATMGRLDPNVRLAGIDINAQTISSARTQMPHGRKVQLTAADIADPTAWPDGEPDVIVADQVLMYLSPGEYENVLTHALRIARRGMLLVEPISLDPNGASVWRDDGIWIHAPTHFLETHPRVRGWSAEPIPTAWGWSGPWEAWGRVVRVHLGDVNDKGHNGQAGLA